MNAVFHHDNHVKVDTVLAIGLYFLSAISMVLWQMTGFFDDPLSMGWSLLLLALVILPLGLRRVFPCTVAAFVTVAFCVATALAVTESTIVTVALFLALYSVGAESTDRTRASCVQGVLVAVLLSVTVITLYMVSTDDSVTGELERNIQGWALSPLVAYSLVIMLINLVYYAAAIWFGNRTWTSKQDRKQLVDLTKALAKQQLQSERQAVTIERMRIARELHDVVAHHLSIMGVQASAARLYLDQDLKISSQALGQIESAAATAVRELQSILHTLRSDEDSQERGSITSLTIDQIPALINEAQSSGLFITFTTVGSATSLPRLASLTLYRITQESLTNVLRHCGSGTKVSVTLRYLPHGVEIEIYNLRPPKRIVNSSGSGLGIIGMRERVEVLGGKLEASSLSQGGFLVRAAIPLMEDTL